MKKITVLAENTAPVVINDDDNTDIEKYTRELSTILDNNNISILHTSSCSAVIRPNTVNVIVVSEETPTKKKKKVEIKPPKEEQPKEENQTEDIITD